MGLRDYLQALDQRGDLLRVRAPISKEYEIPGVLKKLEPRPVLFEQVIGADFPVIGNLFCDKAAFGAYFWRPARRDHPHA